MMKKLLFLIAALFPTAAFADAIELAGINLNMTLEQQQQVLTQSGFECAEQQLPWGTTYLSCKNGEKEIQPSEKKIRYNCSIFNACERSLKELAQAIVDAGVVPDLQFEPRTVNDGARTVFIKRYCGRGTSGDVLCVIADKNLFDQDILLVTVEKGSLGKGGITIE